MKQPRRKPPTDTYAVPALDKGFDILELIASENAGLTLTGIADRLGRTKSEIFRMLVGLQRRGYVHRDSPAETYHLTAKLFEIAHRHPPTQSLLDAAMPAMRSLAADSRQSVHLAVIDGTSALTLANVDSPEPRGFAVRVGARFPLPETASGLVLLAFADLGISMAGPLSQAVRDRLAAIRRRGFERGRSASVRAVIDLSCPVVN
ncbi:MAG TPA: IclR family transcriptional regulator, partial [Tepidisphaeraceae bacterium]